jgi:uncharacterized protein YggU (UPF0235/DUF167 family)
MYIKVKVEAGAKREVVTKKSENTYMISVKEPAERNLANNRIREIMASLLGVSTKNIRIISGHQSPSKILSINFPESLI